MRLLLLSRLLVSNSARCISTSNVLAGGQKWRIERGLPQNRNEYGPLTDLPDWSYADGTPGRLGKSQLFRTKRNEAIAHRVVQGVTMLDSAIGLERKLHSEGNPPRISGNQSGLLPPPHPDDAGRPCLVVDLDETLIHTKFDPVPNADFIVKAFDNEKYYVFKRPHVDEFLQRIGHLFECVLFTAGTEEYADPVLNVLDKRGVFRSRLFRDSCSVHNGIYVKDLSKLGRNLNRVAIVDNTSEAYMLHPHNAIAVPTWYSDPADRNLLDVASLLEKVAKKLSLSIHVPVHDVLRELIPATSVLSGSCSNSKQTM